MTTKLDLAQFERSHARELVFNATNGGMKPAYASEMWRSADQYDALLALAREQQEQIKVLREALQSLYDAFPDCEGGEQGKACKQARQVLKGE